MYARKENERGICRGCGNEFAKTRKWQVYCSSKCRLEDWLAGNPRVKLDQKCKDQTTKQ